MKKKIYLLLLACAVSLFLAACAGTGQEKVAEVAQPAGHPELSDQEKLIACSECHKDATPEVYQQWYDSRHGLDKVKCFQCHGTFENLKKSPDETNCAACHNAQFQHSVQGKSCWSCHPAHGFTAHK